MGKIRVKTLGSEEAEKEQAKEAKKRKEAKEAKKMAKAPGLRGGQKLASMAPSEEEIATSEEKETVVQEKPEEKKTAAKGKSEKKKKNKGQKHKQRSKRYHTESVQIDKNKLYRLSEAVLILKSIGKLQFSPTVELHINTIEKGVSGQVVLPHGTGKEVRVVIADPQKSEAFDELVKKVEKGVIEFDVLIATPAAMPKLARVAKILGPRGLMPNPKAGTISDNPKSVAEKFKGGQVNFRTETQAPIIHTIVGKSTFEQKALEENIETFLRSVGKEKISKVTLKSTMSPGIKLDFSSIS